MAETTSDTDVVELRETSWLGVGLCILGGIMFVLVGIVILLWYLDPPQNPSPAPWAKWALLPVSIAIIGLGIYWLRHSRIGMRIKPTELELTALGVSIPWSEIAEVDTLVFQQQGAMPSQLLLLTLTSTGRSRVRDRPLTNSPHAGKLDPTPDVCINLNFNNLGPGVETITEFANNLRRLIASASSGTASSTSTDALPLPPLDGPLELRNLSGTDEISRVYVHEGCGGSTVVSGSSLRWVTNPLRYASGSQCAKCGPTLDGLLRWEDTGESVARFRSRMWRQTPLIIKLGQFVFLPAAIGVLSVLFFPSSAKLSPTAAMVTSFFVGYVFAVLLIWLTPLAGILPALAGLKYHKYR